MSGGERLLDLMGDLPDVMLEEAWERGKARGVTVKRFCFGIAAAACAMVLFMAFTPAGRVVAMHLKEGIAYLLEQWFPPREMPVYPEGEEEIVPHEVYGSLPEQEEGAPQEAERKAGFAIYFDPERFEAMEEGEDYLIRSKRIEYTREEAISGMAALLEGLSEEEAEQKIEERMAEAQAFYDSMPVCELRIRQIPQIAPKEAAAKLREEFLEQYENVSAITEASLLDGLYFRGDNGSRYDSEIEEVYLADNGLGGVFILRALYDTEAAEGFGARCRAMIETFEVLPPEGSGE